MNSINTKCCLIMFTRYPEIGKVKTRLNGVLGAEKALEIHCGLTEYIRKEILSLAKKIPIDINVQYTGGNETLMKKWLGEEFTYNLQVEGDLGDRMKTAFKNAFDEGFSKIIIIGSDCPELSSEILIESLKYLDGCDLVLGPATDGGYYLIGLSRLIPELFENIPWGTNNVFSLTEKIAIKSSLAYKVLKPLSDIDRPEDIPLWERISGHFK